MTVKKDKERAKEEFIEIIKKSWTYAKLTAEERESVLLRLAFASVKGTFDQRWEALNKEYSAFLDGVGYVPINWREKQ